MVLGIIKIVLIVIVIIIFILLLLMFVSIDYDVDIQKDVKKFKVYMDIKYLFNAMRFKAIYNDGLRYNMRILFLKFNNKKEVLRDDVPVKPITKEPIDGVDYIFYDRDELLADKYDKKSLKVQEKKTKMLSKKREKKKGKKGIFARIIDLIKSKKISVIKYLFSKVKEVIAEIKPNDAKVKWDIFGFDIKMNGRILPIRLLKIALQLYCDKDIRRLIRG